ncbi:MAG: hypothetical protein ACUVSQ_00195 [Pseudanabaenaceae cyanobacterium]
MKKSPIWWAVGGGAIAVFGGRPALGFPCRVPPLEIISKENARQSYAIALSQNHPDLPQREQEYRQWVHRHATALAQCRERHWPRTFGVWLRVYPCDLRPGALEAILDRVVNHGYNRVYLNVFYNGQVLLPARQNPTVWPSVVGESAPHGDLLTRSLALGKQRGLAVHAWMFANNTGPQYIRRADRQDTAVRNGYNETSLQDVRALPEVLQSQQGFVDPYHPQVRADLRTLVQAIAQRRPDGLAIDYLRYPNRTDPWITDVRDMPIYGAASYQALLQRTTPAGANLLYAFLASGRPPLANLAVNTPLWQLPGQVSPVRFRDRVALTAQLWNLAIAHAHQGLVDFLTTISEPARAQNIPVSAVFFPWGDRQQENRVDPRLQPWPKFRQVQEWAPMAYTTCLGTGCLRAEIGQTLARAPQNLRVCPVLAGKWGQSLGDRPPLETQLYDVHQSFPALDCLSHFVYAWLDGAEDRARRSCQR